MDAKFLKPYDPAATEPKIYEKWLADGFFKPETCVEKGVTAAGAPVFSMVEPPPNVTGTLHIGHASMLVIEDIIARYKRMRGFRTLWLPGTDHAAIATQSKVETEIYKEEGKRRQDLGREELLKRVNEFARQSHDTIVDQMKKMGASLDWSREAYTLDEKRSAAVFEAFKRMYDDGLIYQGHRIVNWDPKGQTTISDDEIIYTEEKTKFYYFKYGPFVIGTARPETKFGDKYVVMHPDDARYATYKDGQKIDLEWINGPITATIVKDPSIDMAFGTGVMTITPWHSAVDFDIAERHKLDKEQVIDKYGKLLPIAGEFAGMKIAEARPKIVEKLRAKGLVDKEEDYTHNIATAERTGGIIEPQIMNQWFVDVNKKIAARGGRSLKELMLEVVPEGPMHIDFIPDRFAKVYVNWISNLRDWCISRQIWFGHRIPVWYKGTGATAEKRVSATSPGEGWTQDEDTLDTWFSSGLWTFSTLGWPDKTPDLETYHPTNVLETGYDIIFFWVARMILMSTYLLGQKPFKTVYLHGLVRDAKGQKMSKSLGNIIDPLDMVKKYGTDAVRMSLIVGTGPGNDTKMSEDKIRAYKNFANKLWNIARFVLTAAEGEKVEKDFAAYAPDDEKIRKERHALMVEITKEMDEFKFYLVAEKLYAYAWHEFADIILESSKDILKNGTDEQKKSRKQLLLHTLEKILRALHPFAPFVTEEIWSDMPVPDKRPLIVESWPIMAP
ncbi:MAG: valine--tRNA ligase [Patescibacteria group bacterium]|nr:valine--tRNA ligase [Patescibacteria group bacterium]MDE2116343.1 valine--tRNA ligase [Patescibacteria group bacterium]